MKDVWRVNASKVTAREKSRTAALLAKDMDVLRDIMHDSLMFTHTTGRVDDKDRYLIGIAEGRPRFLSITSEDIQLRPAGSAIVLTSRMHNRILIGSDTKHIDLSTRVTITWAETSGDWRIVAYHATKLT